MYQQYWFIYWNNIEKLIKKYKLLLLVTDSKNSSTHFKILEVSFEKNIVIF